MFLTAFEHVKLFVFIEVFIGMVPGDYFDTGAELPVQGFIVVEPNGVNADIICSNSSLTIGERKILCADTIVICLREILLVFGIIKRLMLPEWTVTNGFAIGVSEDGLTHTFLFPGM